MSQDGSISDGETTNGGLVQALADWIADVGGMVIDWIEGLGSVALFTFRTFLWLTTRMVRRETLIPAFYQIGVRSLFVVALTGTFIGIILAVQAYDQFRMMHMESRLGAVINLSLVRELGPVLAATMLAGRVGSAMAAELGTMRMTEQIDALASMGANPIHYLVVPRFLACLLLIPALTIWADIMGIIGGGRLQRLLVGHRFSSLLDPRATIRQGFRRRRRRFQEPVLRGRHRPDQLLPRFSLRFRRGGRRPRGHDRLRLLVRGHPHARRRAGHRTARRLPVLLAGRSEAVVNHGQARN